MIIIQLLAFLFGLLATFFLVLDTFSMFFRPSLETLKDIMFSVVILVACAAVTGAIQLNLSSTGVF